MVIILVENCWLPEFYYKNEGYSSKKKKSLDRGGRRPKTIESDLKEKVTTQLIFNFRRELQLCHCILFYIKDVWTIVIYQYFFPSQTKVCRQQVEKKQKLQSIRHSKAKVQNKSLFWPSKSRTTEHPSPALFYKMHYMQYWNTPGIFSSQIPLFHPKKKINNFIIRKN